MSHVGHCAPYCLLDPVLVPAGAIRPLTGHTSLPFLSVPASSFSPSRGAAPKLPFRFVFHGVLSSPILSTEGAPAARVLESTHRQQPWSPR